MHTYLDHFLDHAYLISCKVKYIVSQLCYGYNNVLHFSESGRGSFFICELLPYRLDLQAYTMQYYVDTIIGGISLPPTLACNAYTTH